MTNKVYVLDTSAILSEGRKIFDAFADNDVIVPLIVVKELQGKRFDPELNYVARQVLREIWTLTKRGGITEGVSLGKGKGKLRVIVNNVGTTNLPETFKQHVNNDTRILAVAANVAKYPEYKDKEVVLVSKDIELKISAMACGIECDDLEDSAGEADKFITSTQTIYVDDNLISEIYAKGYVKLTEDVPLNTGVILAAKSDAKSSALAIAKKDWIFELVKERKVMGKVGKSAEQTILINQLMDENIGVVSTSGTAGSGKSFLMLAAAMQLLKDDQTLQKIVVFRPVNPVGGQHQELGYLPGDLNEKLAPHMVAVFDTLGTILPTKMDVDKYKRDGLLEFAPISLVRGRTLANCIVILDELQNVEASTILTLLSRLGVNSRVFVGWDTAQRDAQFIGKYDGIYKVVKRLHGNKLFAHTTLKKSERSAISDMVSGLLDDI